MKPRPREEPEPTAEDEEDLAEFVGWILWALDLPEVQAKIRALGQPPAPPHPSRVPVPPHAASGRGNPRRRGR